MHSQFYPLLRNELAKTIRRKLPWFSFAVTWVLCLLVYAAAEQLGKGANVNAWGYTAFSMQLVFTDVGPILIIMFSAMLVSEELGGGTIRAALAAPVHRWEFCAAKAAAGMLYMLVLTAVTLLASVALAKTRYDFGSVGDQFGVVYDWGTAARTFMLAYVLSWVPLSAVVMYGLLISTIVRSPGAAVAVGISLHYLIDFAKHLVGLDPYIFTRHIGYPWLILQQMAQGVDYQWQPEVWKMLGLSGAYTLAGFLASLMLFLRQDLNE